MSKLLQENSKKTFFNADIRKSNADKRRCMFWNICDHLREICENLRSQDFFHKHLENNLKKGFLLLEVVITVAVLSLGLVFLSRSFISSLDAAKISSDYTESISLLENKLWELEMNERNSSFFVSEPPSQSGDFGAEYEGFNWNYLVSPLAENPLLEEIKLQVSWIKARRKGGVDLTTYMYASQE